MEREYLELVPDWYKTTKKLDLVLSDDIDSLASCSLLKKVKGWDIKYFYDFENVYASRDLEVMQHKRCWVDVATKDGYAFDNHVSRVSMWDDWNKDMINLNMQSWISNENYSDKFAGSTLLMVWSLFNYPLPKTEKGMMLFLSIDSAFKGFYSDNFHGIQKHYLCDVLGFDELYKVIKRHKQYEFYDLIAELGLNAEIKYKDGHLETRLNLHEIGRLLELEIELPTMDNFFLWRELEIVEDKVRDYHHTTNDISSKIITLAFTYKGAVRYSKKKLTDEERKKEDEKKLDYIQWIHGKRTTA